MEEMKAAHEQKAAAPQKLHLDGKSISINMILGANNATQKDKRPDSPMKRK